MGILDMDVFLSPISCGQDSSRHDLPCIPKGGFQQLLIKGAAAKKTPVVLYKLCLTLWDPMDCSTPGFSVHHQLPDITQTHVHRLGDAIQPYI